MGRSIGPPGVRSDLRDDPVAEAVRTADPEKDRSTPPCHGSPAPRLTSSILRDRKEGVDIAPQPYDLNFPL